MRARARAPASYRPGCTVADDADVRELQAELGKRGLAMTGQKVELSERLLIAAMSDREAGRDRAMGSPCSFALWWPGPVLLHIALETVHKRPCKGPQPNPPPL